MEIKKLKVNGFGKIKNKEINLSSGINIIYGKNESGKSTLLNFIIGILYGSSKNKRGKDISDFDKYTPWDTEDFSGKMEYSLDNKECFEIFREFKRKNPKIFDKNMEDISKNFKNDKANGIRFFEEQTGITEEAFTDTVIIKQDETKLGKSSQSNIIQKIGNKISTGEDSVSFKKILEKINKAQLEKIGSNKTVQKPINIVNNEIKKLNNEYEKFEIDNKKIEEINIKINKEKIQIEEENLKLDFLKKYCEILENNKINTAKIDFSKDLDDGYEEKIKDLQNKLNKEKENSFSKGNKNLFLICIEILLILIFILIYLKKKLKIMIILSIISFILLVVTYISRIFKIKKQRNKNESYNKLKSELEFIKEAREQRERKLKNENLKLIKQLEEEKEKIKLKYNEKLDYSFIKNSLIMNLEEVKIAIDNKNSLINNIKMQINIENKEIENLKNLQESKVKIEEKIEYFEEEKRELEQLNNNYEIAKEALNSAYINMKKGISPRFQDNLSSTIYEISDGKYSKIKFDDETGLTVELENGNYISADRLSIGTIDQMYMALRLNAIDQISKEKMPIILDEAFAFYDEERLKNILDILNKLDNQVIILTCSKREEEILKNLQIEYKLINL